jgi:glycosyltransferase involved in cell wall biosynthesis
MSLIKKRNLLYLNSMPFEMLAEQGRIWEVEGRNLGDYCELACSIYFGSDKNRIVEIEPGRNRCYCVKNTTFRIKMAIFRYLYRLYYFLKLIILIGVICRKNRIDAIVSQSNALRDLELASLIVSKVLRIPMLGYMGRNYTTFKPNDCISRKILLLIETFVLHGVDGVILRPGSESFFLQYYKLNPEKIITIPHTTRFSDSLVLTPLPENLKEWIGDRKLLLYYGRIEEDKLVADIIRSFHLLENIFSNIRLLLVGCGNDSKRYVDLANDLGIGNSLKWENQMSHEKLAVISSRADVHIHPTGGKGLLESAVMGRPVITYDTNTYDYGLIEHMKTGLKAQFRNVESMTECVKIYINDQSLANRHGKALKRAAIAGSDQTVIQHKFSSAIERLISGKEI